MRTTSLLQISAFNEITATLLACACIALTGCETASMRSELAPPPPAFEVTALEEVHTVVRQEDVAMIEPAAGNAATVIKTSAAPSSCMQIGLKEDDDLYYQWGDKRFGLDFASNDGGDRFEDNSQARFRYSFSLQKNAPDRACRDDLASDRFRSVVSQIIK